MSRLEPHDVDARGRPKGVVRVDTASGRRIFLLPVETFPGHVNNVYFVEDPDLPLLFDVGTASGHGELQARFEEMRTRYGVATRLPDVRLAVVSHAHLDHFGNAHWFRERGVPLAIHELDARVLSMFAERLALASRDLGLYFQHAGVDPDLARRLLQMYRIEKNFFTDLEPDRRLRNGEVVGPGYRVLHVPGHCPGMVCLAVDDVVLTADHLLSRITPAQRPQSITPFMGLETYLRSLERLRDLGSFTLGLGAHEAPIGDVRGRIDETMSHHAERLRRVRDLCRDDARTVAQVSMALFGDQRGYGILLALLEAGAHLEYLHELGHLAIENVHEVADDARVAARYRAR